jgi:hypothetical protein
VGVEGEVNLKPRNSLALRSAWPNTKEKKTGLDIQRTKNEYYCPMGKALPIRMLAQDMCDVRALQALSLSKHDCANNVGLPYAERLGYGNGDRHLSVCATWLHKGLVAQGSLTAEDMVWRRPRSRMLPTDEAV